MEFTLVHKNAWDMIVEHDGLYFRVSSQGSQNDQYFRLNGEVVQEIDRTQFLQAKFGRAFEHILPQLESDTEVSRRLSNGNTLCCGFRDSRFQWFNAAGDCIQVLEDISGNSIYGFDLDTEGNIWFVLPTEHYLGCYSPQLSQDIFHLGGIDCEGEPLNYPEDIIFYEPYLYVSNMGDSTVYTVNSETKLLRLYLRCPDDVWEYRQYAGHEFVRLKDGIYRV